MRKEHVRESVPLTPDMLSTVDAVVIVTDHRAIDYQMVVDHAPLVLDTRNITAGLKAGRARIRSLADAPDGRYERRRKPRD